MPRKTDVLYVKGMKKTLYDEGDVWDDQKLNVAYEKAMNIVNSDVAKRVAMATNNQNKKAGQSSSKKGKTPTKGNLDKNGQTEWKSGMPCRAVYEEDGLEYEAFVLRIIDEEECVVRFLGYENSEIVTISSLKPTLGKEAQTRQIEKALEDFKSDEEYTSQSQSQENMECSSERVISPTSTEKSFQRRKSTKKKKTPHARQASLLPDMPFAMPQMSELRNLGQMDMPLPPPPPLTLSDRTDSEDQAVSSMLLSWYMSGYYTGLYQGLKRAKEDRRNK